VVVVPPPRVVVVVVSAASVVVVVVVVVTHVPPESHVPPEPQGEPVFDVTTHDEVPLHVRMLHSSLVQVIVLPAHWPLPSQVSPYVQASLSSHDCPAFGVTVQDAVPLQLRMLH
jgi:hypothetical protein